MEIPGPILFASLLRPCRAWIIRLVVYLSYLALVTDQLPVFFCFSTESLCTVSFLTVLNIRSINFKKSQEIDQVPLSLYLLPRTPGWPGVDAANLERSTVGWIESCVIRPTRVKYRNPVASFISASALTLALPLGITYTLPAYLQLTSSLAPLLPPLRHPLSFHPSSSFSFLFHPSPISLFNLFYL